MKLWSQAVIALLLPILNGAACAAEAQPVQGVVNLSASASVEVARDTLSLTLTATRDGTEPGAVQSALKQALDAALAEARKVAKPGQVEVQAGNFSLFPRYNKQNVISGWQGSTELVVEGRDMPAIAALSGRITTMTIARVSYSLSRELREKVEAEVVAQAITRYRARAADYAKQFGYSGFAIREVTVSGSEPSYPPPRMMQAKAMSASADEALPVEPGKGTVTATVSGSVQMK